MIVTFFGRLMLQSKHGSGYVITLRFVARKDRFKTTVLQVYRTSTGIRGRSQYGEDNSRSFVKFFMVKICKLTVAVFFTS